MLWRVVVEFCSTIRVLDFRTLWECSHSSFKVQELWKHPGATNIHFYQKKGESGSHEQIDGKFDLIITKSPEKRSDGLLSYYLAPNGRVYDYARNKFD